MLDNLRMTCANQVLDCYDAGKGGASAAYPPTLAPAASNLVVGLRQRTVEITHVNTVAIKTYRYKFQIKHAKVPEIHSATLGFTCLPGLQFAIRHAWRICIPVIHLITEILGCPLVTDLVHLAANIEVQNMNHSESLTPFPLRLKYRWFAWVVAPNTPQLHSFQWRYFKNRENQLRKPLMVPQALITTGCDSTAEVVFFLN